MHDLLNERDTGVHIAPRLQPKGQLRRPGPIRISDETGIWLRWVARIWGTIATLAFIAMAMRGGVPRGLEAETWEVPAQLAMLGIVAVGGLLSWRWQALGASLITLGAVAMGVLAAIEYSPPVALLVALPLYLPGLLLWLDWQRNQPFPAVAVLAIAMIVMLGAAGYQANQVYLSYNGPTHPQSALVAQPVTLVEWIWSGGLTDDSLTVKAGLARNSDAVHLLVSESADMSDPTVVGPQIADLQINLRQVTFNVQGLQPGTRYFYAVEADGELDISRQGRFQTLENGPFSFTFGVGGCALTGSNGMVFDTIRELDPRFFVFNGDLFYENISDNEPALFRDAYRTILTTPAQSALYLSTPIVHMWDDHDYGPNNSDRTSPSRAASQQVNREMVPSYPLEIDGETGPIYHAFGVGRVRFIVTDGRSEKSPRSAPDTAGKSMLGERQKEWFKRELLAANGAYPLIVWVQSVPWIAEPSEGADSWAGYTTERREIADFIADNDISGLVMLAGDAHMTAIDDGTNSDYSTSGGAGFPVFHSAALDRPGSVKGGPYSEGTSPDGGQFGLVTVIDEGGPILRVTLSGRNYKNEETVSYSFTVPAGN